MKYQLLNEKTNNIPVALNLELQELKMLHNACIDIISKNPEMIGYKKVKNKLYRSILEIEQINQNTMLLNSLYEYFGG